MASGGKKSDRDSEATVRAREMSHPLRLAMTSVLIQRPASAVEIAAEIDQPVDKVRYQLRRLSDAGLIEVHEERVKRGVVERFYIAPEEKMVFTPEEVEELSGRAKIMMCATILRAIVAEATKALAAGKMTGRDDAVVARTPLRVDEQGWNELIEICHDAFARIQNVRVESERRLTETGDPGVIASAVLLCFEAARAASQGEFGSRSQESAPHDR